MTIATETKAKLPPSNMNLPKSFTVWKQAGNATRHSENLMQIIGIYKAYAVPMDFYWRNLLYIAERVFFRSVSSNTSSQKYLDLHNHYAGDDADLRIWRGKPLPIGTSGIYGRVKPSKCPSCCTTGCMTESTWSLLKNVCGRCSGTADMGWGY